MTEIHAMSGMPVASGRPPRKLEYFERLLQRSPSGGALLVVMQAHAAEVFALVTRQRRVAATWQRNRGPAFIRAVVDSGFIESAKIPKEIGGVTLELLLLRMADALQRHGSLELRRAIAGNGPAVLQWARECDSLHDLFRSLECSEEAHS